MLIAEMDCQTGSVFEGEYRISAVERRMTRGGAPYLAMRVADMSGSISVYDWKEKLAQCHDDIGPMDCVRMQGQLRNINQSWIADMLEVEVLNAPFHDPVKLIPAEQCPLQEGLCDLHSLLESLTIPELQGFARTVLSDDSVAFPFVNAPASIRHHHNQPGGLLAHSIECADIIAGMFWFPPHIRELGIVAALFHDVGKTATMTGEMKRTSIGYLVDHDFLNLEALAHPLQALDTEWPDGGRALRYLLSWDKGRFSQSIPLMTIAEAVRFADRCSTGIYMEEKVYEGLPDRQQFVKAQVGGKYWRPRLPLSQVDRSNNSAKEA